MIDEQDLRRLLGEAAEAIPAPGRAPDALLAALTEPPAPRSRSWNRSRGLKVLVAAALVGAVAISATMIGSNGGDSAARSSVADSASRLSKTDAAFTSAGGSAGSAASTTVPRLRQTQKSGLASGVRSPVNALTPARPVDSAKVIKSGSLDLEIAKGGFERTVDRVTTKTVGLGGYIASSTTRQSDHVPSGSVVVRVPSDSYEGLLTDLRKLGKVNEVTSKGTDVSAQFTDLAARLTALTATRDRLSAVLGQANSVGDILAVQDRITNVQVEIEQIQGQQKLLEDQTSMATLAVSLAEPGAKTTPRHADADHGLGQAWRDARRRFGNGIEGIVAWSAPALLALALGLALFFGARLAWIGLRRRAV
jgi:Domain of unknown function (DUF4349)